MRDQGRFLFLGLFAGAACLLRKELDTYKAAAPPLRWAFRALSRRSGSFSLVPARKRWFRLLGTRSTTGGRLDRNALYRSGIGPRSPLD
jgi:hypothetical protein